MKKTVLAAFAALFAHTAWSQTWEYTLRAADQPSAANRPWEQGASFSYQSINGKSSTQEDIVLKAAATWFQRLAAAPGEKPETGGSIKWNVSPGIYLHKTSNASKPQDDRGASLGFGGHWVPGGSAAGGVLDFDFGASLSEGQTLKAGTGSAQGRYFDVDSNREIAFVSMYWQPGRGAYDPSKKSVYYVALSGKAYSDSVSGAQSNVANGRVSGLMLWAQGSWAPFGLDPAKNPVGNFGFAPVLSVTAQQQHDTSASGGRTKDNRQLYTATASLPFTNNDKDSKGPVPSIDIQRSVGADVLQGRDYRGETRVMFALKF